LAAKGEAVSPVGWPVEDGGIVWGIGPIAPNGRRRRDVNGIAVQQRLTGQLLRQRISEWTIVFQDEKTHDQRTIVRQIPRKNTGQIAVKPSGWPRRLTWSPPSSGKAVAARTGIRSRLHTPSES
jgi:hypothetical protein